MTQVEVLKFVGFVAEVSPKVFINRRNELILVPSKNIYFSLNGVESKRDITVKIFHWLSRPAHKGVGSYWETRIRTIINNYLQTNFSRNDFDLIYTKLGNAINPELTGKLIDLDYDLHALEQEEE